MWRVSVCEGGFLLLLAAGAFWDLKRRAVPGLYLIVFVAAACMCRIFLLEESSVLWLTAALVGLVFLTLSRYTEEGIGYADSVAILGLGILLGIWRLLVLLMTAFAFAALAGLTGMKILKWGRESRIPFFPFLLIGYVGAILW